MLDHLEIDLAAFPNVTIIMYALWCSAQTRLQTRNALDFPTLDDNTQRLLRQVDCFLPLTGLDPGFLKRRGVCVCGGGGGCGPYIKQLYTKSVGSTIQLLNNKAKQNINFG